MIFCWKRAIIALASWRRRQTNSLSYAISVLSSVLGDEGYVSIVEYTVGDRELIDKRFRNGVTG